MISLWISNTLSLLSGDNLEETMASPPLAAHVRSTLILPDAPPREDDGFGGKHQEAHLGQAYLAGLGDGTVVLLSAPSGYAPSGGGEARGALEIGDMFSVGDAPVRCLRMDEGALVMSSGNVLVRRGAGGRGGWQVMRVGGGGGWLCGSSIVTEALGGGLVWVSEGGGMCLGSVAGGSENGCGEEVVWDEVHVGETVLSLSYDASNRCHVVQTLEEERGVSRLRLYAEEGLKLVWSMALNKGTHSTDTLFPKG